MARPLTDMSGQRVGRLTVICRSGSYYAGWKSVPLWLCRCDCGKEVLVRSDSLRNGNTKSCGCLKRDLSRERCYKNNPKKGEYWQWK